MALQSSPVNAQGAARNSLAVAGKPDVEKKANCFVRLVQRVCLYFKKFFNSISCGCLFSSVQKPVSKLSDRSLASNGNASLDGDKQGTSATIGDKPPVDGEQENPHSVQEAVSLLEKQVELLGRDTCDKLNQIKPHLEADSLEKIRVMGKIGFSFDLPLHLLNPLCALCMSPEALALAERPLRLFRTSPGGESEVSSASSQGASGSLHTSSVDVDKKGPVAKAARILFQELFTIESQRRGLDEGLLEVWKFLASLLELPSGEDLSEEMTLQGMEEKGIKALGAVMTSTSLPRELGVRAEEVIRSAFADGYRPTKEYITQVISNALNDASCKGRDGNYRLFGWFAQEVSTRYPSLWSEVYPKEGLINRLIEKLKNGGVRNQQTLIDLGNLIIKNETFNEKKAEENFKDLVDLGLEAVDTLHVVQTLVKKLLEKHLQLISENLIQDLLKNIIQRLKTELGRLLTGANTPPLVLCLSTMGQSLAECETVPLHPEMTPKFIEEARTSYSIGISIRLAFPSLEEKLDELWNLLSRRASA